MVSAPGLVNGRTCELQPGDSIVYILTGRGGVVQRLKIFRVPASAHNLNLNLIIDHL